MSADGLVDGIRIVVNVSLTVNEIDTFADVMENIVRKGALVQARLPPAVPEIDSPPPMRYHARRMNGRTPVEEGGTWRLVTP
jgi:hypothetical protein